MRFALLLASALLSGCVPPPGSFSKAAESSIPLPGQYEASPAPAPEIARSLSGLFNSPDLTRLIHQAVRNNPNIQVSAARLEEAGFNTRRTQAARYPTLNGSSSAGFTSNSLERNRYSVGLDSQWEVDVWGRVRAGIKAASSNEKALAADYAAAKQSIAAQTTQAYFDLVAASQLLDLTERSLASFEKTYQLVNSRFGRGLSNLSELDLTRTDLERTRAQLSARRDARDRAARQLSLLLGAYPDADRNAQTFPSLNRTVSSGIPSTILRKRPDVIAAYQRIRAADENVKVAHADLFPRFTLTGNTGRQSSTLRRLANSSFSSWSLLANMSAPLLDGGTRRSELGAANARARQALRQYQATVLNTLREVENALGSEQYLASQESASARALQAARSAEDQIRRNYESGLVELLNLLESQRRAFNTEETLINTRAQRFQNRVSLALALGKAF